MGAMHMEGSGEQRRVVESAYVAARNEALYERTMTLRWQRRRLARQVDQLDPSERATYQAVRDELWARGDGPAPAGSG